MATLLHRRALLRGLCVLPPLLLLRPAPVRAMGGILPDLDQPAPAFELPGVAPQPGGDVRNVDLGLADFRGSWLVLYFYPRDFTSGCTLEARGFQRDLPLFARQSARVVGVSADDAESHEAFCGSEGLAYPLLSDPGGEVSRRYGSWMAPYSMRHTFLIDPEGVLRARWSGVNPSRHSAEVLAELKRLQGLARA